MGKKITITAFALLGLLCLFNCKTIIYGVQQGAGQLKIVRNAEPLDDFLKNDSYPDSLKEKIELVKEIKQFAFDSLGINFSENYSKLYDQKGKPGMWVVTACKPYELKQYFWKFPFLGKFSYKGFFKESRAKKEAKRLQKLGYDTDISPVNAWSTLGWFDDPVMSSMLKKSPGQLARVLIHELTHGTLFVKDSITYNENLATFIGDKGAEIFLKHKYGKDSEELKNYVEYEQDMEKFTKHMIQGAHDLEFFYKHLPSNTSMQEKNIQKRNFINQIILDLDTLQPNKFNRFDKVKAKKNSINNTFFTDFLTYRKEQNNFEDELSNAFNNDFNAYLRHLKEKYPSL